MEAFCEVGLPRSCSLQGLPEQRGAAHRKGARPLPSSQVLPPCFTPEKRPPLPGPRGGQALAGAPSPGSCPLCCGLTVRGSAMSSEGKLVPVHGRGRELTPCLWALHCFPARQRRYPIWPGGSTVPFISPRARGPKVPHRRPCRNQRLPTPSDWMLQSSQAPVYQLHKWL